MHVIDQGVESRRRRSLSQCRQSSFQSGSFLEWRRGDHGVRAFAEALNNELSLLGLRACQKFAKGLQPWAVKVGKKCFAAFPR